MPPGHVYYHRCVFGISSVSAAARIRYFYGENFKIIIVLRDPVERLISRYMQDLYNRRVAPRHETVSQLQNYQRDHPLEPILFPNWWDVVPETGIDEYTNTSALQLRETSKYIVTTLYVNYIKYWMRFFPNHSNYFIVDGNAFRRNPVPTLQLLERFLGVKPFIQDFMFRRQGNSSFYCISSKKYMPDVMDDLCARSSKGFKPRPLHPKVIELLRKFFRPSVLELQALLGRNFSWPTVRVPLTN